MFQDRLYKLRKEQGLSQEELADLLGVSRQAVQKWESGAAQPTLEKLTSLARYFNVTLDWLVNGSEPASGQTEATATVIHNYYGNKTYEYKSDRSLLGLPLVHVHWGYGLCHAKGIIAVGNIATGVIAVGGLSAGLLSLGGLSVGVLLSLGGLSLGCFAFGGVAVGLVALGAVAVGHIGFGGAVIAQYAVGGAALGGKLAIGGSASAAVAVGGEAAKGATAFLADGSADLAAIAAAVREACRSLPHWLGELMVRIATGL